MLHAGRFLAMSETKSAQTADAGGTEVTSFNALRHGLLSRYTVLPWEDAARWAVSGNE